MIRKTIHNGSGAMKRISMVALPVSVLIFVCVTIAHAQSSPRDPQDHMSDQLNHLGDKTQPVKPQPDMGHCKQSRKVCPRSRYIDCMPPVKEENRLMCSMEYLEWIKEHCPDVEAVY